MKLLFYWHNQKYISYYGRFFNIFYNFDINQKYISDEY
jgi:hypothetical protein